MVGAGDHCHDRLGRKEFMQYVLLLLDAEDATEQLRSAKPYPSVRTDISFSELFYTVFFDQLRVV